MKIKNKIISFILTICMILGLLPATAFASEKTNTQKELTDGDYLVNIKEIQSDGSQEVSYLGMNINPRVVLQVRSGKFTVMAKLRGYDQWSTVELFDQTKYGDVEAVKAGTNWTGYDSMPMDRYATTVSTQGDEKQNDYWSQISKSTMIDENLHTGIITFSLNDISEKFTLGGYAEYENSGKQFSVLSVQNYKLDLNTITNSNSLSYLAYGFGDGTEFNLDADRAIPIVTNIKYNNNDTPEGLFSTNFIEKTTVSGENGVVTAKFKVADDASEEIQSIKLIASTDVKKALAKNRQTYYQGYLLGTYGNIYGDNIYNQDTKEFTIDFSGSDNSLSLMTGVDVQIITKENAKGYRAVLYLSESGLKMANYKDDKTDTEYSVYSKYASTASSLVVKSADNADEYPVEQIKQIADGDKWKAYTFDLQDTNGNSVTPEKGGYVEVPIPSEWNSDDTYFAYYVGTNKNTDSNGGSVYSGCSKIIDKNGKKYLRYKTLSNNWINGGTIVMCQVLKEAELSELQEDGTYSATVKFIKADTDSTLSMANGALETSAYVKIKDGKKDVYLNFHPITMNESEGWYAYLGAIWNKTKDDCTEYDYEVNEDGSLLDNSGFDAIDEFSCLKSVKVILSDETITDNSYTFKVIPPAMGADLPYEKVSNDPIDANLKFYNVKKIDESTVQIPTYQKSVLRKAIDKAERYNESSYSSDSWATLKSVLEDGKAYYDTLAGTDAGTDATISNAIKEKSDAIEKAIKALEENPELTEARANLKNAIDEARKVELGNKTVSAFNELTAVINSAQATYEKSNVTVDELNKQAEILNAAVETFNNSADASKLNPVNLEDGDYKVYVDMKKIDKATDSMSNNAIDHWINLNVTNGVYTATLDFKGMTISGKFGYLQTLKYYDAGYTYDSAGNPQGTLKDTTVLTTQKDAEGNDIIDNFNDKDNLYPDTMSFPLVDKGTQDFVPLQVFVPLMESLTAGTGTQDVLMRIDWTSLKTADDDTQEEINLDDGLYTVSSDIREAGSDEKSSFNDYLDKVRLIAKDGKITAYIDFKTIGEGENEKYIKEISFVDGEGQGTNGKMERAELTLPQNVEFSKIKITDSTGATADARLYLDLRNASSQKADKSTLEKFISKANEIKEDGKTYTEDSLKALNDALKAAEKVDADKVAIDSEINAAGLTLKNAIDTMEEVEEVTVDKTTLEDLIKKAEKIDNDDKTYTEESYKNLTDAIKNAKAVLENEKAEQSDVDAQVTLLQAAMDALEKEGTLDKKDLKAMIEKAEALNDEKDTYTADSWNALSAAYTAAVKVYQDENATQNAVDAQVKSLKAAMNALVKVSTGKLADGVYQITGEFQNATNPEKLSMADGALEYTEKTDAEGNTVKEKDPLYLVVKDGKASIRMHFVSLTSDLNGTAFTGYLGELKYYPDYDDTTKEPGKDEKLADATVEASYEGYDEYNDPDFGSDSYMKGKAYPEIVSIPVELEDNEIWVQVYVPVMEGITAGSGTQNARLRLDWGSVKQVRDESVDISNLEKQIGYAKEVEQGKASDETWNALQQAIKSTQAVYDNLSSTQEQVDAQVAFLQKAMAAVQAENDQTADKTELQALIATANEKLAQKDVYTADSLQTLQTILTYAQGVYENKDADQTAVDAAANALSSAINSLKEIETVDTYALETEIANAEELAKKTDVYTADSLNTLQIAINNAKRVLASDTKTQESVDAQVKALKNAEAGLIEKAVVDKTALKAKIEEAQKYAADTSTYTASSIAALKEAISSAQTIYNDENATQATVDAQVKALDKAIGNLVKAGDNTQDITKLADGVYSISGTMVKVDKNTYSMSNDAINHTIKLTVKNGKYYITLNFNGLTVGQKLGYLSQLKYFTTGYTVDKYGNPQGTLADVTIESYQKNADGTLVSDSYGTNYPDVVTFELIPEALNDGYVPLQVFVPIMDAISSGTGTQPVYLKLDWSSLKATTSDDPDFDKNDNNNSNSNGNNNSNSSIGNSSLGNNTLGSSSLGSSKLGSSSLGSGSSSLKSGTSSLGSGSSLKSASNVKTGDVVQNNTLWAAILLLGGVALLAGIMEYNRKKKANVK